MRTVVLLASAALVLAGCTGGNGSAPGPDPTPTVISQAEARTSVSVDGVDGTAITWTDTTAAQGDPVDVVKYLTAIELVGENYDGSIDPAVVKAFSDPPFLLNAIDPESFEAREFGPIVGDTRAFASLLYTSSPGAADDFAGAEGEYVLVGQCVDRSKQTTPDAPDAPSPRNPNHVVMLQQVEDADGSTVWKVRADSGSGTSAPKATAAVAAFTDKCDAFLPPPS